MNLTLYDIAAEFRDIASQLEAMDIDDQTLADTLESARYPVEQKARAVAMVCANIEATADAYITHAKQADAKGKALLKRAAWLKEYLLSNMESCGIEEISAPGMTVKIKQNPPSVEVFDPVQIPEEFLRQTEPPPPSPDKKAIMEALKLGCDVSGARLVRGKRIEIK